VARRTQYPGNSEPGEGVKGSVYLLHFEPPYKQARHYLGWTEGEVEDRLDTHRSGKGSPLIKAAVEAGCAIVLVRVWENVDRHFERALKDANNTPRLCPICNGTATLTDEPLVTVQP
jgi:hypothetical protein